MKNGKRYSYYESTEYDNFIHTEVNRNPDPNNVKRLAKSIGEIGQIQPIIVTVLNGKLHIIDGGNRVDACKIVGIPVKYIISSVEDSVKTMASLNHIRKSWTNNDYVKSYIAIQNQNYIEYQNFIEKYPDFPNNVTGIILAVDGGRFTGACFKSGDFKVGELNSAYQYAEELIDIKSHSNAYRHLRFVKTLTYIRKNPRYEHKVFLNNIQKPKFRNYFDGLDSSARMSFAIYEVYNERLKEENRLP